MKIKVCGITTLEQLHELAALGIHYAGFIFYPPSPRHAERFGLRGAQVKAVRYPLYKVGVFVDAGYEEVLRRVEEYGLDMVQLHGRESPWTCEQLMPHIDVIKALRFAENDHVEWTIRHYTASTDLLLLDTGVPAPKEERENKALHGGIGRRFSWNRLRGLAVDKPFLLSGGIEPGDAAYIRSFLTDSAARSLAGVDLNSRFESAPGIKDVEKIRRFIAELGGTQ
ncbi:phosphoribosylanthranilate isomerase [Flaviaesturariibacter amylovorans]|uniref:N-(5'-phosphoribosyl)anthranilate isomerase n=1 Tax=Flaviaesturariibacter amylovorans TaxID=1084520 RepID=A0ABP8HEI0_9BACT